MSPYKPLPYPLFWLKTLLIRFFKQGFLYRAAYLAYLTLITLIPLLALAVTIVSHFYWFRNMVDQWQNWLVHNLLIGHASNIQPLVNQLIYHASSLSVWHLLTFLIIAILMMINISRCFQAVWEKQAHFSWSLRFLVYLLVLLISPILLALLFAISGFFSHWLHTTMNRLNMGFLVPVISWLSHLFLLIWLTLMNWIIPATRVPFRAALISGVCTTLLIWVAKYGYGVFFTHFTTYQQLYGALAVIPLFLVWLYLSWIVILLGALIGQAAVLPPKSRPPHSAT